MKKTLALLMLPLSLTGITFAATNALGIDNNTGVTWNDADTSTCANIVMPKTIKPNTKFSDTDNAITFKSGYEANSLCTASYKDANDATHFVRVTVSKDSNGAFVSHSSDTTYAEPTAYGAEMVVPSSVYHMIHHHYV
jgi:hypothetical protein